MTNVCPSIKIPSMAIGVAGLALSAYNVVVDGNAKAEAKTIEQLGEDYLDVYKEDLASSKESHLLEKAKKFVLMEKLDNSFHPFWVTTKKHVSSWFGETIENIVPITLSVLALFGPKLAEKIKAGELKGSVGKFFETVDGCIGKVGSKIGDFFEKHKIHQKIVDYAKNRHEFMKTQGAGTKIASAAAVLLLLGTGKFVIHDVLGVGKHRE